MPQLEERPKVNYILIEVRERDKTDGHSLDAGIIRRAVHDVARRYGIDESDMIMRHDQEFTFYGGLNPWRSCREVMEVIKADIERYRRSHATALR
jgi:hypothetical protein